MSNITENLGRLISLGGNPLSHNPLRFRNVAPHLLGKLGYELEALLKRKNGFYAFRSALHVLPVCDEEGIMDLEQWNSRRLWIDKYDDMALGTLFFAEGIFGDQFGIRENQVVRFEAETGLSEPIADSLEDWATLILEDYNYQTGYPLGRKWQEKHGVLPEGQRLVAITPFVLGGAFEVENLFAWDAVTAMRYHAELALRIRDLPDGTKIKLVIED